MNKFLNKREIARRIVAMPITQRGVFGPAAYKVKHDIPGEAIICEVLSLEIAGCIVKALRARQEVKLAEHLLSKHLHKGKGK